MLLLIILLGTAVGCDRWVINTILNKTAVPVRVTINDRDQITVRPYGKHRSPTSPTVLPGVYPGKPEVKPPPTYTIKAYEFLPGKGDIFGWVEEDGTFVRGGRGDLIFCVTYTWEELKAMNFTITITRNVFPGYHPPGCPP